MRRLYRHRNADGSWLYVCHRCGREAVPQDENPEGKCLAKDWPHCTRPPLQLPVTKEERNEE